LKEFVNEKVYWLKSANDVGFEDL